MVLQMIEVLLGEDEGHHARAKPSRGDLIPHDQPVALLTTGPRPKGAKPSTPISREGTGAFDSPAGSPTGDRFTPPATARCAWEGLARWHSQTEP